MRLLVVGTGGVGSAFAGIARRRSFFERCTLADYDDDRPRALVDRLGRRPVQRPPCRRVEPQDVARLIAETKADAVLNAVDPRLQHADLRRLPRGEGDLPRHGHVALAAASAQAVRGDERQAGRRAVRAGGYVGVGGLPRPRRHRDRARRGGRLRPARGGRALHRDRRGRGPRRRRTSSSRATTSPPPSRSGRRSRSA